MAWPLRSRWRSVFAMGSHNYLLLATMALSFVLTAAVVFIPGLRSAFSFAEITLWEFLIAIAFGAVVVPVSELMKLIRSREFLKEGKKTH